MQFDFIAIYGDTVELYHHYPGSNRPVYELLQFAFQHLISYLQIEPSKRRSSLCSVIISNLIICKAARLILLLLHLQRIKSRLVTELRLCCWQLYLEEQIMFKNRSLFVTFQRSVTFLFTKWVISVADTQSFCVDE